MGKKGVLRGKKISKQHSTYNGVAEKVILALKENPLVNKIALGPIKHLSGGSRRVTVREDKGQVRIQCRDIGSVQVLWAMGTSPENVRQFLEGQLSIEVCG